MMAAALHTAGSTRTSGCAAGVSATRSGSNAGLGNTWETPRRQITLIATRSTRRLTAWARPVELAIDGLMGCGRKGYTPALPKHLQHSLINLARPPAIGIPMTGGAFDPGRGRHRRPGSETSDRHFAAPFPLENVQVGRVPNLWIFSGHPRRNFMSRHRVRLVVDFFVARILGLQNPGTRPEFFLAQSSPEFFTFCPSRRKRTWNFFMSELEPRDVIVVQSALAGSIGSESGRDCERLARRCDGGAGAGFGIAAAPNEPAALPTPPAGLPEAAAPMIRIIKIAEIDGRGRRGRGVFAYHAPEYPLVCGYSRQPLLDACRQLKSLYGLSRQRAGLFREGRNTPDISCPVEVGAATTVSDGGRGVRFVKYVDLAKVFPRAAVVGTGPDIFPEKPQPPPGP
jgi:hypothetical protein